MNPETVVVGVFRPHVAQLRHDFLGEQLARAHALVFRHVADVNQTEDVADAKPVISSFICAATVSGLPAIT